MQNKVFNNKGFSLLEFTIVLFILGIIICIAAPKYQQFKLISEWYADEAVIWNIAKSAELYVASLNEDISSVSIQTLIKCNMLEKDLTLKGRKDISDNFIKNETSVLISSFGKVEFTFNKATRRVNNLGEVVKTMIGEPPHGKMPTYPCDKIGREESISRH